MNDKNKAKSILLVNSPRIWPRLAPLGLASLAGWLSYHAVSVDVIDLNQFFYQRMPANIKKLWEIPVFPAFSLKLWDFLRGQYPDLFHDALNQVIAHPAAVIGLSVWHSNYFFSRELVSEIKRSAPEKVIVAGGPDVTLACNLGETLALEKYFFADTLVAGEGERSLLNILTSGSVNGVKIHYFNETQTADEIPAPDFSVLKQYQYPYSGAYPVWMNRGCIRRCAFCVEHTLCRMFRTKSPAKMVDELERFYRNDGISHFIFYDSLINGNLILFEEFLDLLIERGLPIKWEAQVLIRPDMPDRIFGKMKKAGCYNMFVGLESGSDRILAQVRKGFTTADASRFFARCSDAGLHFEISLIVGFPGETNDDIKATMVFLDRNAGIIPKLAQINPYLDLPGSPMNMKKRGKDEMRDDVLFLEKKRTQKTFSTHDVSELDYISSELHGRLDSPTVAQVRGWIDEIVALCKSRNIRVTSAYINNLLALDADFDAEKGRIVI